jgi:hypothetical protein
MTLSYNELCRIQEEIIAQKEKDKADPDVVLILDSQEETEQTKIGEDQLPDLNQDEDSNLDKLADRVETEDTQNKQDSITEKE